MNVIMNKKHNVNILFKTLNRQYFLMSCKKKIKNQVKQSSSPVHQASCRLFECLTYSDNRAATMSTLPCLLSDPRSSFSLFRFAFWNCLSYHSRHSAYLHISWLQIRFVIFIQGSLPSLLSQVPFCLDPHESENLSSPHITVAMWKNKRWQ